LIAGFATFSIGPGEDDAVVRVTWGISMKIAWLGLAVAACLVSGHAMAAGPIDCAKLDMSFKSDNWKVRCYGDSDLGNIDYAFNQTIFQELLATHGYEMIDVIDQRESSSQVYFRRSGTKHYLEQGFKNVPINNWSDQDSIDGYEVGYFDSTLDHDDVKCIGFSHYGRNRVVAGFSCTADGDYKKAAEALKSLGR
jgi:uncharacterized membrane protein